MIRAMMNWYLAYSICSAVWSHSWLSDSHSAISLGRYASSPSLYFAQYSVKWAASEPAKPAGARHHRRPQRGQLGQVRVVALAVLRPVLGEVVGQRAGDAGEYPHRRRVAVVQYR